MREAIERCADGGAIFIGDVRDLSILPAYHASLQQHKAGRKLTDPELAARVTMAMEGEQELALAASLFLALAARMPRIGYVEIRPKRGRIANEMTRFRYDVVLRIGQPATNAETIEGHDWRSTPLGAAEIAELLERNQPATMVLRHVANARLWRERQLASRLRARALPEAEGIDPEAIWNLAASLPYDVDIRLEPEDGDGAFAARLVRRGTPTAGSWSWPSISTDDWAGVRERAAAPEPGAAPGAGAEGASQGFAAGSHDPGDDSRSWTNSL